MTSPTAASTAYTHVRSGSAGWRLAVYLVPVSDPNSGTVVETAQARAGRTSMRWIASVSPGSAPSTWNGPVWGLMNGYVIVRLGRSVTDRIRPPNASSVNRSRTSPGRMRMIGAQPPNVHAYWSSVGTN